MPNPIIDHIRMNNTVHDIADAQARQDISDLKSAIDEEISLRQLAIDETSFEIGYVSPEDGKIYGLSLGSFIHSPFIRCAFKRIKFNCLTASSNVASIAFYSDNNDNDGSFLGCYVNTDSLSNLPEHEMDVETGTKYIRISKQSSSSYVGNISPFVISKDSVEKISERIESVSETANEALYKIDNIDPSEVLEDVYRSVYSDINLIDATKITPNSIIRNDNGEVKTITNTGASDYVKCVSDYIPVKQGETLYLSGDNFKYSQTYGWYDSQKQYLGGKDTYGAMNYHLHIASVVVPTNAAYLRVTFHTESDAESAWADYTGTAPTGEVINATNAEYLDYHYYPENPCDFIGRDICTFNKIACIGDSITAGYFNHSGGGQTITKYSYPAHLQKITGVECVNMGDSGETSVSWWEAHQNEDFSSYDCAIINLGINDALLSISEADTRAAFANIISALKSASTGIKIFIANVNPAYSRGNTTYDAINAIIEDIATSTENCYFINLTQYGHAVGVAYANGHLTAVGYWMLAEDYANAISHIIRNNPEDFRFIQFIGMNLHD